MYGIMAPCGKKEMVRSKLTETALSGRMTINTVCNTGRDGPITSIVQAAFEDERFDV